MLGVGPARHGSIVEAEAQLNRERVRRAGTLSAVASFALIVLAACGGEASLEEELADVTRVPTMSEAAAQATRTAPDEAATPEPGGGTPVSGTQASTPIAGDETPPTTVEVISYDIYFEPTSLTIPANTDVTVVLPNEGVTAHNFSIDALGIDVDLAPGATEEVVINASAGEYEFYCNVPGHKEAGMVGTLIVSEDAAAAPAGAATPAGAPAAAAQGSPVATPAEQATPAAATPSTAATAAAAATPGAAGTPESPTTSGAAAETAEVVSLDIFFEPDELMIPADSEVTVALPNEGVTEHNFSIDALNIDVDIAPGAAEETVINAPAGTYEYYCNVPGHKAAGMVGTLTVE